MITKDIEGTDLKVIDNTDKTLTVQEIAKLLNKSDEYVRKFIKERNIKPISYKMIEGQKGRLNKKVNLYSYDVFTNQQQQLVENLEKSTTGAELGTALVIKADKELNLDNLYLLQNQINNLIQEKQKTTIQLLEEKVDNLETELGRNKEYYSIKRVSMLNNKSQKDYNWRLLKNKSFELSKEIKKEQDSNYGIVKSYHIDVWKVCYPNENY